MAGIMSLKKMENHMLFDVGIIFKFFCAELRAEKTSWKLTELSHVCPGGRTNSVVNHRIRLHNKRKGPFVLYRRREHAGENISGTI
jgi:hypothetical protein